uniref:Tryptophan synthase alpha chain n=1 Tax=Candidatus Kentrum sp. TUN TaxID=2126343 RepID=A0A450ZNK2_9GAMM|nr:MAG: tryptophan synthase, alpha chain [Candidatus Kentron sp. TUN]VFK55337.1 MAG: tryptophan synthase, alpha chain [Candidatus Kentron sp. TUN]VFK60415.1 MAG: tryptophan synthase, alpha chain [Candidatus Kentron sp. TUN]
MSRITQCFNRLADEGGKALISFVTAGDPTASVTVPLLHGLAAAGSDIIELGVPFSDPMADGPVIQRASERALAAGISLKDVLEMAKTFRTQNSQTPLVLMGYANPIEVMGYAKFVAEASDAGIDGILTVDLPPEEAAPLVETTRQYNLDPIFLLAPNTSKERITRISEQSSGFLYYVSLKGVTGAGHLDIASVAKKVSEIKTLTNLPIGVGFGVKDGESASRVAGIGDAVVIGSVLVEKIEALANSPDNIPQKVSSIVAKMRTAIDNPNTSY